MLRKIFRLIKPKVKSPQIECKPQVTHDLYNKYKEILEMAIRLGQGGAFALVPKSISLSLTRNCNLDCIMCFFPKSANYFPLDEIKRMVQFTTHKPTFGKVSTIELTSAESFLHPEIDHITKYLKRRLPNVDLLLVTNGTLKVRGKIKEAVRDIDRIFISVDGAKKETFEHIRRNANFEHVLQNIRDIVAIKQPMAQHVDLVFVAMANNIHELPDLVRLASALGVASIVVQKLELREGVQYDSMKLYALDNLSREAVRSILDKTMEESRKTGVSVHIVDILPPEKAKSGVPAVKGQTLHLQRKAAVNECVFAPADPGADLEDFDIKCMCSALWDMSPAFNEKEVLYPCCHMQSAEHQNHYDPCALRKMNLLDFYNSHDYWSMRTKILSGEFANTVCKDCQLYKFSLWTKKSLKNLRKFISTIATIPGTGN